MVIPKPNLSGTSQNAIRDLISNNVSNADQATRDLRQYIITSLVKLRIREQIWFIKTCIAEKLTTRRLWNTVERLNLRRTQGEKLRQTLMKNHRNDLHQKMARVRRDVEEIEHTAKELLTEEQFATLKQCKEQEEKYARRKIREHYKDRLSWIRKKTKERKEETLPKEIDGVKMEDQTLDTKFNTSVTCYGGVSLDDDEKEALRLQPNFAVYDEVDDLRFMANTEKTFNALRWNEAFQRSKREDEVSEAGTSEEQQENARGSQREENDAEKTDPFFNEVTKTFDATRIRNRDVPFRKRVTIPEFADPATEAKLTLCRERLNKVLEEYKEKQTKPESNLTKQQKQGLNKRKRREKSGEIRFQIDKSPISINFIKRTLPHKMAIFHKNQMFFAELSTKSTFS